MERGGISKLTLQRLPTYLSYLQSLPDGGGETVSASSIAAALGLGEVQVRKDLAAVSVAGKPKVGYHIDELKRDLERFLGCGTRNRAVLVGVGNLGLALLSYGGFADYGLDIVAAFDSKSALVGTTVDGKPVLPIEELPTFSRRERVRIGILAVPGKAAQTCLNALVQGGVKAVWNFAPVHLTAPKGVLVQRENMASSLALLSYHLKLEEQKEPKQS
jgi:redox-sensing transcriptional repressor